MRSMAMRALTVGVGPARIEAFVAGSVETETELFPYLLVAASAPNAVWRFAERGRWRAGKWRAGSIGYRSDAPHGADCRF